MNNQNGIKSLIIKLFLILIMPKFKIKFPLLFEAEYDLDIDINDIKVAWNIYCELQTRIGIVDFNENEDIIETCFKSWYKLFSLVRDKLKEIKVPLRKRKEKETQKNLDEIIFQLLNYHIRPFLRKWHYQFNSYWEKNYESGKDPITTQKSFPQYSNLIEDVKILQKKLKEILTALEIIVRWNKRKYFFSRLFIILKISIFILIIAALIGVYIIILAPIITAII